MMNATLATQSGDEQKLEVEKARLRQEYPGVDLYTLWQRLLALFNKSRLLAFIEALCTLLASDGEGKKLSDLIPYANARVADVPAIQAASDFRANRLEERTKARLVVWFCDHLEYHQWLPLGFPESVQVADEPPVDFVTAIDGDETLADEELGDWMN
jgi:hypothetical protein